MKVTKIGKWYFHVSLDRKWHSFGLGFDLFGDRLNYGVIIDLAFWQFIFQVENEYYGDTYS